MSTVNKLYVKTELFAPKIDGTDFATADWAYLGTVDQNLAIADEVEFNTLSVSSGGAFTTKFATGATANYTVTFPVSAGTTGDILTNTGAGVMAWTASGGFDQDLNTTNDVTFNDLILTGDLTVQGTTTLIDSTNLAITDNTIVLNKDEVGAGVTLGTAGIEIERGSVANAYLLYLESADKWVTGFTSGVVLGTDRFYVAEWSDGTQTQGSIPGADANGRLSEAEGLTPQEVNQLQNIDSTLITIGQWGYLGATDQGLAQADSVTFADATLNAGGLTVGASTPSATQWGYVAELDQALTAAATPSFAQLSVDQVDLNDGKVTFSGATTANQLIVPDNLADALRVTDGTQDYIQIVSLTGADQVKLLQDTDVTGDLTVSGTVAGLTQAELGELGNIGATTIDATQWGYLGAADQGITQASAVAFAQVSVDQLDLNDGKLTYSGATGANEVVVPDNLADAWSLTDGAQDYIQIVSTTGSDQVKLLQDTDVTGDLTVSGTVAGLTQAELGELGNIGATTIDATQWGYLGALDQGLTQASNVTFNDLTVNGALTLSEPLATSVSATLTADPAPIADGISIFDTSGGAVAPVLPANATNAGKTFTVYLLTAGNNLTITRAGADTIEGNTTFVLDTAGQFARLTSLGNGTWIVG